LLALSLSAQADLYRCDVGGKPVYQDTPCSGGAKVKIILKQPSSPPPPPTSRLNPNAAAPTESDSSASYQRERATVLRASQMDEERESKRAHAWRLELQEEQARAAEHNAKVQRCQRAEIDVQRVEADARTYPKDAWWKNRAVAEREKFRMECW